MALNTLRLNEKKLHPTPHIIFIKPLADRSDAAIAHEYLSRVAAICHPILKKHYLSVTTLEEFEPNREFVGRNFNHGECIQLVLRTHSGAGNGWLPFRTVVMVMMHELAHIAQMNHSKAFWAVRNAYAAEMRTLWTRGYTGEGMWGPGRQAASGITVGGGREPDEAEMPDHLCGGTFRSRRQRKRKPKLSWREQKERQIAKKFGTNGQKLGEDMVERMALQGFKGPTTKSRVANSKRGRELRAAAALARFGKQKDEEVKQEVKTGPENDENAELSGEEDDEEEYEDPDGNVEDAKDYDGSRMKDENGHGLIRVCGDDDANDINVKEEMDELQDLARIPWRSTQSYQVGASQEAKKVKYEVEESSSSSALDHGKALKAKSRIEPKESRALQPERGGPLKSSKARQTTKDQTISDMNYSDNQNTVSGTSEVQCKVCSVVNNQNALLCLVCSNVLDPDRSPGAWKCTSETCQESTYLNPADYGICGVCGAKKTN